MSGHPPSNPARQSPWAHWLGLGIVAAAFVLAAALSWRKWPDVVVDFGSQLYLPWKISTGSVLYRDIQYLPGGPFSQCFDAVLFKVFGVSLLTLVVSNLILAAGLLGMIYRRFLALSDAWTATLICLGVVLVFAFAQYSDRGNYNYVTPYCQEVWQGLVISIVAVGWLSDWVARERLRFALGAGFCAGLVFMTKPEVFTALAAGAAAAFALFVATKGRMPFVLKSLGGFVLAAMVPLFGFALWFHRSEDWAASLRTVGYAWVPLMSSSVSGGAFYRWGLGLDAPGFNIRLMLVQFLVLVLVLAICGVLFRRKMDTAANRMAAVGVTALLLVLSSGWDWRDCGRTLPLVSAGLCLVLCVKYKELSREAPAGFALIWSIFGLVLLAKLGLFSRIWHYGFALAMPAFVGAIYFLHWLLPDLLRKYGVNWRLWRGAVGLLLMTGILSLFVQSQFVLRKKTVAVGRGGDRIMAFDEKTDPVGTALAQALPWMETNMPPDATLAVLPEGIMVNYLSRRTNPTRYPVWDPPELRAFGQSNMVADFETHRPDYIMLIHRDEAEYGMKYFGQEADFGLELMQWIQRNYEPALLLGAEPLRNSMFGVKILRRVVTAR